QRATAAAPAGDTGTAEAAVEPVVSKTTAPANAKDDPVHQAVAAEMGVKAKHQRTPIKTPEDKRDETVLAAKEESRLITDKSNAYKSSVGNLDKLQPKDLTVPEFMAEFLAVINKLEKKVPKDNSDDERASFWVAKIVAKQDAA